jgi:hypothetical protein
MTEHIYQTDKTGKNMENGSWNSKDDWLILMSKWESKIKSWKIYTNVAKDIAGKTWDGAVEGYWFVWFKEID